MMTDHGKSDNSVLPRKSSNKARQRVAERMEGRELAKGKTLKQTTPRTQGRRGVPSALERIREVAQKDRKQRFTALLHHAYAVDRLRESYFRLKREATPGIDGETWRHYGEKLEENLQDLSERLKRGAYRARPVQRVYIPKADGRQRPIGVPVLEDKIVQRAVAEVMGAIYEQDFLGFSYGFRPGRSTHQALDALAVGLMTKKVNWVLDADIRGFLETSSYYTPFHERLSKRVAWISMTLIYKPFRFPERTWTAESSPRFTRCNTVWRETPSSLVASSIDTWPSGTS
jgi:RNA-directed DNA polymerase